MLIPYICNQYGLDRRVSGYIDNNPAKQGEEVALISKKVKIYSAAFLESLCAGMHCTIIQLWEKAESKITGIYKSSVEPLIPQIIHYCWFSGRPIPEKLKNCMESWHEKCPDYEIVRWDESNYDHKKYPNTRQAYEAEKWGFIPDIARLEILYKYEGFYLDTDVELLKGLDDLRYQQGFCGREDWGHVNFGGGSGCVKHLDMVGELLDFRKDMPFFAAGRYNVETSGYFETKPLMDKGLSIKNQTEIVNGFTVYASEFSSI